MLDLRDSLSLMNVRSQTSLIATFGINIGRFPSCQLLEPAVIDVQVRVDVPPPIQRQALPISCMGAITGVTASSLGNPSSAVHQAVFMSFVDIAACAFSDVEALDFSSSMFGMTLGSEVGQHYRGTVVSFLVCMASIGAVSLIFMQTYSDFKGLSRQAIAARVHFPSLLVVPYSVLIEGVALSCVSLLRLSLNALDVVLAAVTILGCTAFVGFTFAVCSRRWGFSCLQEERETTSEGEHLAKPIRVFFSFTEPRIRWIDASDDMHKRRYLLFFNDFKWQWYCAAELLVALANGLLQGIRINDPAVCYKTAAALVALHGSMLLVCVVTRPCSAQSDSFFLYTAKTLATCCAAVTLVSALREDDSLLATVEAMGTWGSILENIHIAVTIIAAIAKALVGWGLRKPHADQGEKDGEVELLTVFAHDGERDSLSAVGRVVGDLMKARCQLGPSSKGQASPQTSTSRRHVSSHDYATAADIIRSEQHTAGHEQVPDGAEMAIVCAFLDALVSEEAEDRDPGKAKLIEALTLWCHRDQEGSMMHGPNGHTEEPSRSQHREATSLDDPSAAANDAALVRRILEQLIVAALPDDTSRNERLANLVQAVCLGHRLKLRKQK